MPITVDRYRARYAKRGIAGLANRRPSGGKGQVPPQTRSRMIALTKMTPPPETGLSHWSTRTLADYLKRAEGISVSIHYIARTWRVTWTATADEILAKACLVATNVKKLVQNNAK